MAAQTQTQPMDINPPTINIDESNLQRYPTNSSMDPIEEDPDHKQDWTLTTSPKDSWAVKERRRSSVWGKMDRASGAPTLPSSPKKSTAPRRGSILSMWRGGKDKEGRDILEHNDQDESDDEEAVGSEKGMGSPLEKTISQEEKVPQERRGSILSMWKSGKDERGRTVIEHDDEEWKV